MTAVVPATLPRVTASFSLGRGGGPHQALCSRWMGPSCPLFTPYWRLQTGLSHLSARSRYTTPEGEPLLSPRGRLYDCICANSCVMQVPLDLAGGSIYDNATPSKSRVHFSRYWSIIAGACPGYTAQARAHPQRLLPPRRQPGIAWSACVCSWAPTGRRLMRLSEVCQATRG